MRGRWKRGLLLPAVVILCWWAAAASGRWSAYLLPSPARVLRALAELVCSGALFRSMGVSILRVAAGFSLAFAAAMLLAILQVISPALGRYTRPLIDFARNVPPLSLIPLLILWFGIGEPSKVALIFLSAFFAVLLNVENGFSCCDRGLLEVGAVFGLTRAQIFCRILLPAATPDILAGIRVGLGYSWRAIVGAEMIAAESGLGYLILDAQYLARTDQVIAGILMIGLTGYCCDRLLGWLIHLWLRKEGLCE